MKIFWDAGERLKGLTTPNVSRISAQGSRKPLRKDRASTLTWVFILFYSLSLSILFFILSYSFSSFYSSSYSSLIQLLPLNSFRISNCCGHSCKFFARKPSVSLGRLPRKQKLQSRIVRVRHCGRTLIRPLQLLQVFRVALLGFFDISNQFESRQVVFAFLSLSLKFVKIDSCCLKISWRTRCFSHFLTRQVWLTSCPDSTWSMLPLFAASRAPTHWLHLGRPFG